MRFGDVLFGRRLANRERETRRIGWVEAVPAMGLDALASSSYGPEAALAVMIPLGAAAGAHVGPVIGCVVALLLILYLSYRQTVAAYRNNGGAYVVAKENLGRLPSLLAAAALMIDYVLNVAVGISAGVGALTSSLPALHPYTLTLCLGVLAVVTLVNLRGTGEAGWLFAAPTYLFALSFLGLIGVGLFRGLARGAHPLPAAAPSGAHLATHTAGLWLLLRAFAAGCTAMTGVEAVSNGVGAFKPPVVRQAHATLTVICVLLALLLTGVAVLVPRYGLHAMDQTQVGYQSVMSQLAAAIVGRGWLYGVAMASLLCVLCLSANTSFVGFPRVCALVARDDFLPRAFASEDRRLVFAAGIGVLAAVAGALLAAFGGITDRLIPLFAVGAFLTFGMSQLGMVRHWLRQGDRGTGRLLVNALGAAATFGALAVILAAKFLEGAWIVVLAVPAVIALLLGVRRYYNDLDARLKPDGAFSLPELEPPTVLVAIEARSRMTDQAVQLAMTLSPDVIALHLLDLRGTSMEGGGSLKTRWRAEVGAPLAQAGHRVPRIVLLNASRRTVHEPLLRFLRKIDERTPGRSVVVIIPQIVRRRWWEALLHTRRAERLRRALLRDGGSRLTVMTMPWRG